MLAETLVQSFRKSKRMFCLRCRNKSYNSFESLMLDKGIVLGQLSILSNMKYISDKESNEIRNDIQNSIEYYKKGINSNDIKK